MRIELGDHARVASVTTGASTDALDWERSRSDLLRSLVRAHQRLVEARWQLQQARSPADPQVERDLAAVGERISKLLSSRGESRPELEPPLGAGDEESSDG